MSKRRKERFKSSRNEKKSKVYREMKGKMREIFADNPTQSFSIKQIVEKVGARNREATKELSNYVFKLEEEGVVKHDGDNKFISTHKSEELIGRVDHVNPRFAFIVVNEESEDIWVKTEDLNFAVDSDIVKVRPKPKGRGKKIEGVVVDIIERGRKDLVGKLELSANFAFVIPDNKNIHIDVFLHPEDVKEAKNGEKVVVAIKSWHNAKAKSPVGNIIEVLGPAGTHEAEIHAIMAEFGLPFRFPANVEKAAEKFPETVDAREHKHRRDFRQITTFTIDPHDAKDFDDAISLQKLSNGNYEVGVHIADVTHYLRPDTILEAEAYNRATSVYLVDRTIPMLPERLSNNLCSLRPDVDRLTFSAVFELDKNAGVVKEWFGRTLIHSDRRFTYEEAQERIERKEGDFQEEINILNDLAKILKERKFKNGAIAFETTEVKFNLDEAGKPIGIFVKERKDAHKLVEEFMLLANKKVATFIAHKKYKGKECTFVYRTHDNPDPEKLDTFARFAGRFGHKLQLDPTSLPASMNQLMTDIYKKPEQSLLESLAIRSMAKAKYTTDPKGHFGLAFEHYSHFTSPIRRYPDVMVHRLLQHYLDGGSPVDKETYEEKCLHSSEREKRAADAERASIKFKQVEFMSDTGGKVFEGIVTGVTEWGIYVEITETKCEGMIRMQEMDDDHYTYDEKNLCIIGRNNKRMITLGDKLNVTVIKTDIGRRTIDLLEVKE